MDSSHHHPGSGLSARAGLGPGTGRRLRLIPRTDATIVRKFDALEATYSSHHSQVLLSLDALEVELESVDLAEARGAHEQISFIRVGLRCLSDAVGELQAHVTQLARETSNDPGPDSPRRPA
jgi:hypothetical protein